MAAHGDAPTALQRQLGQPPSKPRPDALAAFKLARRKMLRCERIDINALADELGVNRVTIYRWVGSRQQLVGEVVWSLVERTIDRERERIRIPGRRGAAAVLTASVHAIARHPGWNHLLDTEGDATVRLWTRSDSGFQPRLIAKFEQLLDDSADPNEPPVGVSNSELAFAALRLSESFVYRKHITGEEPDLDAVGPVLGLLLR